MERVLAARRAAQRPSASPTPASASAYGAPATYRGHPNYTNRYTQRASLTYVTGSHTFKAGVQIEHLLTDNYFITNGNVNYTFRNGSPISILQRTTPYLELDARATSSASSPRINGGSNRFTFNYGLRFDYFNGYVPAQDCRARPMKVLDRFPGAPRTIRGSASASSTRVDGIPSWKDINPRFGASYDLFGNGRTALKFVARPLRRQDQRRRRRRLLNPITTSVNTATRGRGPTANRNYCAGLRSRQLRRQRRVRRDQQPELRQEQPARDPLDATRSAAAGACATTTGTSAPEIQHELLRALGQRRLLPQHRRLLFATPTASSGSPTTWRDPEDFDPFCVTAPLDPRLPGGGGYQVCGLYAIKQDKFGQSQNLVSRSSNFGPASYVNHFFNVTFDARLARGARIGGGVDTGRSIQDNCFVVDSPQELLNCREVTPFKAQTQLKLNGSLPLPGEFVVAMTFQNISGPPYEANYPATSEEIAPSLGRPLAGGTRTATVPLVAPYTLLEDRTSRLDLRISKIFHVEPRPRAAESRRLQRAELRFDSLGQLQPSMRGGGSRTRLSTRSHVQVGGQGFAAF